MNDWSMMAPDPSNPDLLTLDLSTLDPNTLDRITLDPGDQGPLSMQIAMRLRSAIATEPWRPARDFLGPHLCRRNWASLAARLTRPTTCSRAKAPSRHAAPPELIVSEQVDRLARLPAQRALGLARPRVAATAAPLPFQRGLPALDAFPRKLWVRPDRESRAGDD